MPRTTCAPRRQVAGSARNKFWRLRDRPRRRANPPELLARPRGLPSPGLDPARCRWSLSVMRTTQGRVAPQRVRQIAFRRRPTEPRQRPRPRPDRPQHTRNTTSQTSVSGFTDQCLRTLPHRTITRSPSAPPSGCSTRVALEEIRASPVETTVVSIAVVAGSPESTVKRNGEGVHRQ
jgi:hypothetical protein